MMAEFKSMDRRKFIRKSSLGLLALPLITSTHGHLGPKKEKDNHSTYK